MYNIYNNIGNIKSVIFSTSPRLLEYTGCIDIELPSKSYRRFMTCHETTWVLQ